MPAKPLKDTRNESDSRKALEYAWERFRVNILVKANVSADTQHVARAVFYTGAMAFYRAMIDDASVETMTGLERELEKYKNNQLNPDIEVVLGINRFSEVEEKKKKGNAKKPN